MYNFRILHFFFLLLKKHILNSAYGTSFIRKPYKVFKVSLLNKIFQN